MIILLLFQPLSFEYIFKWAFVRIDTFCHLNIISIYRQSQGTNCCSHYSLQKMLILSDWKAFLLSWLCNDIKKSFKCECRENMRTITWNECDILNWYLYAFAKRVKMQIRFNETNRILYAGHTPTDTLSKYFYVSLFLSSVLIINVLRF